MKSATCKKKKQFPNQRTANRMIEKIWRVKQWDTSYGLRPTSSYQCPDCSKWHMTSQQQKERKSA